MLVLATLALGDVRDATCTNDAAHDTALLATTINASAAGDLLRIHGSCLVRETICLRGDRAYVGDSRSGTIIQQAGGAYLAAVLASDTWCENTRGRARRFASRRSPSTPTARTTMARSAS